MNPTTNARSGRWCNEEKGQCRHDCYGHDCHARTAKPGPEALAALAKTTALLQMAIGGVSGFVAGSVCTAWWLWVKPW